MAKKSIINPSKSDVLTEFAKWIGKKKNTVRHIGIYVTTLKDIRAAFNNRIIQFEDLNDHFFEDLYRYWTSKNPPIQNSSIIKRITCFKSFLKEVHPEKSSVFRVSGLNLRTLKRNPIIIPSMAEFEKIVHAESNIPKKEWSPSLALARDYYVIGATTGLNSGEITTLTQDNLKKIRNRGAFIWIPFSRYDKTGRTIPLIPLSKHFITTLLKESPRQGRMKRVPINKLNKNLHQLFKLLYLNTPTRTIKMYGVIRNLQTSPKYELMTINSSRQFFIFTCVNNNVDTLSNIMGWVNPSIGNKFLQYLAWSKPKPNQTLKATFSSIKVPKRRTS